MEESKRREVEETATGNAYFLPETLNISGNAQTQKLHADLRPVVYRAQTVLSGKFVPAGFWPPQKSICKACNGRTRL